MNNITTAPFFTPYSTGHMKNIHELKALLNAAKERVTELELFIEDLENNEDHQSTDCNHEDDEIIAEWVADVVSQSKFKGVQYLVEEIERKAGEGRVVFSKELKDALNVK